MWRTSGSAGGAGLWAGAFIALWDWRSRGKQTAIPGAASVPRDAQKQLLAPDGGGLGAIARARDGRAIELFRNVMVASASVPAVFPPMLIDAEAGGKSFQEMHVDGGISANVFTLPRSFLSSNNANPTKLSHGRMFIIINTMPLPEFKPTEDRTTTIVGRTIALSLTQQIRLDLQATYEASVRKGFAFNLTYIRPQDLLGLAGSDGLGFDTDRMRRLYEIGFRRATTGTFWQTSPTSPGTSAKIAER